MPSSIDFWICCACGTQFNDKDSSSDDICRICDDPRQFVPPHGQELLTLRDMRNEDFKNAWKQDDVDKRIWSVWTEPKFGIGQRAMLLQTEHGNVLWDLITYLDEDTITKIHSLGGLDAIVISHPHYYTTHVEWSEAFQCPVYTSKEDEQWLHRHNGNNRLINGSTETVVDGVTAVKTGGHFDGSLVLHWEDKLFIADSMVTVPSALYHVDRLPGTTSYSFMWSIPNMIPLPPDKIFGIWQALKRFDFTTTHGAFLGLDVRDKGVKGRVLESAKIQVWAEGYQQHKLLEEIWP